MIRNGDGPTVLLMAGNHGDEYEGQVTMVRLIRDLEAADLRGRVIVMPAANLPAAMAGARVSPLDARAEGIMRAFGAPRSVRVTAAPDGRLAAASGHRRKIPYLGGEYGGTASVDPDGVAITYDGTLRVLAHLGVLASRRFDVKPAGPTRLMELGGHDYYMHAPEAGLFEPASRLGDAVKQGQLCGTVHFVDHPERPGVAVKFKRDGIVVCKRHLGRVEPGDCVAHLATDF